jgi:DNA-binding PadR family transcriptional regulator
MARQISPTSFALLGLLSLRSWTTYELARQSERSLHWFFPRAERAIYQEAKRLVGLGWAAAAESWVGRRRRTTYRITASGRRALVDWLSQQPTPLQIESEGVLRIFFADQSGLAAMRASVHAMHEDARAALAQLAAMAQQWETAQMPFPERGPTNAVAMRLVGDLHRTVANWADWADGAIDQIERGPDSARQLANEVFADVATDASEPDDSAAP